MTRLPFAPDVKVIDLLKQTPFTLSAEVIPPRNGAAQADILRQISTLIEAGAQFLSVTKGAGGSLRGGSLPIAQLVKESFRTPCIAHFTCRDLLPEEVENQIMDHHYFGIRNILALRGDPPTGEMEWKQRPEAHNFAYQLIQQIRDLNSGKYLERKGFKVDQREATDFCIGCAVYPDHPNLEERIDFFRLKVGAGAEYAITQMLFSPDSYYDFLERCAKVGILVPVLPGTRILKSQSQARKMAARFEVAMPDSFLNTLPAEDTGTTPEQIIEPFFKLTEKFRAAGAPGMHLFVLSDTELCCRALRQLTASQGQARLG